MTKFISLPLQKRTKIENLIKVQVSKLTVNRIPTYKKRNSKRLIKTRISNDIITYVLDGNIVDSIEDVK